MGYIDRLLQSDIPSKTLSRMTRLIDPTGKGLAQATISKWRRQISDPSTRNLELLYKAIDAIESGNIEYPRLSSFKSGKHQ